MVNSVFNFHYTVLIFYEYIRILDYNGTVRQVVHLRDALRPERRDFNDETPLGLCGLGRTHAYTIYITDLSTSRLRTSSCYENGHCTADPCSQPPVCQGYWPEKRALFLIQNTSISESLSERSL